MSYIYSQITTGDVRDPHPVATVRGFFRRFVPRVFKRGLGDLEGFDSDPVDGLLWVATRPDPSYGWYQFRWGDPDSRWIFEAWSGSKRMREALVKAFVHTLREPD